MNQYTKFLSPYFLFVYLLFVLTNLLFTLRIGSWSPATALVVLPALLVYPFLQLVPVLLFSLGTVLCTKKLERFRSVAAGVATVLPAYLIHLFLLLDAGLYFRYGYHVNPHVINIFTTPGGFEGMGMSPGEIILLGSGIVLLALFHCGIFVLFFKVEKLHLRKTPSLLISAGAAAFLGAAAGVSYLSYAYAHYTVNPPPLTAAEVIPFYTGGTAKSFFRKLGIKKPSHEAVMIKLSRTDHLPEYPAEPIRRSAKRPRYNVVWLSCESWANRLFTDKIMPQTAAFARKGMVFKKHYSGGNVTRQGVFSMFYALPGNYWHAFLANRHGPVFIDWLKEDGYRIRCITSSKFSYPEFDQTVFAAVPKEHLHSDSKGSGYERDARNVELLLDSIRQGASSGKPFFSFMFFESVHHPYTFPQDSIVYPDYLKAFNAVSASPANADAIFKRAANAARHMDQCLGKVFKLLEELDLMKNTIVVAAGDHGEEYFEKGYLGHSSRFNEEQTRTPLIIYYPGIKPGVYEKMSSHLDIIPMLAGLFGVENPAEDYSCGMDLLSPSSPGRRYALIANWDEVFFAGDKYKSYIPLDAADLAKQVITDHQDRPLPDTSLFYREYAKDLIKVQKELTRFTAR